MEDCEEARLLLHGACEVVVELAISGVEEELAIRKCLFLRGIGSEKKVSLRGVGESLVEPHTSPT